MYILLLLSTFIVSTGLTGLLRARALRVNCVDIPNQRSSHVVPTPRGGGLAFVISFLIGLWGFAWGIGRSTPLLMALSVIGVVIAGVGWLDDRRGLSAIQRLGVHVIVAGVVVICFATPLAALYPQVSWLLMGGAVIWLVSLVNIFNFLDGIDGYDVMETLFLASVMGGVSWYDGQHEMAWILGLLAAAVLGFGKWNFPSAKIFMGDAGSGFLGGILGVCAVAMGTENILYGWMWVILMAGFIVDASITILVRLSHRERIWEAHCQHAYQHATKYFQSHVPVTLGMFAVNIGVLLPLAWLVWKGFCVPWLGAVVAYLMVGGLAWYWGAGQKKRL